MILHNIGAGWKAAFEDKLIQVTQLFPESTIESISNFEGMLRIKFLSLDNSIQYVLDCVAYKIERDSAKICELCGKFGRRTQKEDSFFPQRKCLCWTCYAMEIDSMESHNMNKSSD